MLSDLIVVRLFRLYLVFSPNKPTAIKKLIIQEQMSVYSITSLTLYYDLQPQGIFRRTIKEILLG